MRAPIWILMPALSLAPAPLPAQGTISDDDAAFVRGTLAFGGTPNADFVGVSVPGSEDHVFQTGWWFRLTGATQESPAGASLDFFAYLAVNIIVACGVPVAGIFCDGFESEDTFYWSVPPP